ncbi:MAG: fused MFS/spermidine synthase [Thermoanaerobaculia bacterium]|nr:fused MFS/spermidine synthase [Thermoanaerobaculia bacterium]
MTSKRARGAPSPAADGAPAAVASRLLLLLAPFAAGAAIMALELVGMRLLAPRFGASTYVWGGLLGTIMAALALGYLLGGWLADRDPRPVWISRMLLVSAAWTAADLFAAEAMLDIAERLGATLGPIVATTVLLVPPMVVLGSVSPFVIRLEGRLASLGTTSGRIFALSTAGSLAGTFAASFWWIPAYGSRNTLRIVIVGLVLLGTAGGVRARSRVVRAAAALGLAAASLLAPDPPLPKGIVFAADSPYNTVYVEEQRGYRLLRLNSPRSGFHSMQLGGGLTTGLYYDVLYLAPHLAGGRDVLVLGMGGGTTVRAYRRFYPGARLTAVEIDPVIVRVANERMGVEPGPDLAVHVADARPFLQGGAEAFDVIEVDVFAGGPYAPFYCLTREFFAAARRRLEPSGLLAMNVYAPGGDRTLVEAVIATLGAVFPSVYEQALDEESVLIAFREEIPLATLRERLANPGLSGELRLLAQRTLHALRPAAAGGGVVLTDDRAPVEALTHAMIARRERLPPQRSGG